MSRTALKVSLKGNNLIKKDVVTNDIYIKGDNIVTKKGCEGVNDDIMHMNIIHITSIEGGG